MRNTPIPLLLAFALYSAPIAASVDGLVDSATGAAVDPATQTELNDHASDTTTHGTTGDVVGTSDSQTLTNKTISQASNTITITSVAEGAVTAHVGAIDHDATLNFVLNEHIDWTGDQGATNIHAGNIPDLSGTYATAAQGASADTAFGWGDHGAAGYQSVLTNSAGLAGALSDETGSGDAVFGTAPTIQGVITWTGTAVNDDDCTGQQGQGWWDSTDTQFEWCNANSGVPDTIGAGGGSGDMEATTYDPNTVAGDAFLTSNMNATAWRVFYSDGSGDVSELALGTSGTFLQSNGATSIPSFAVPAGSGDVSKVGTPVDGQLGVWTGDGTIEGDASLTFDTTDDTLVVAASGKYAFGAVDILADSAGTTTLQNIDGIDAATETALEATLELESLQGAVTDGQVPNDITIDLATTATTATTANAGDSATAFFSSGEIEDARIPNGITIDLATTATTATTANAGDSATAFFSSGGVEDAYVVDTITASNYLPLAGGTLTGELVLDETGIEGQPTDTLTDCSTFSATGGGLFYDDSEGVWKKCQDNVLTAMDSLDASLITGKDVTTCASDGDIMVYRTSSGDYECEAKPAAGSNPAAADVSVAASPSNYTAGTADVEAHLAGIDTALGSSGAVDSVFTRTGAVTAQSGDYTADLITETAGEKIMTAAERTKLGNIETAADVTDVTNVTAAGALMDSEVDADIKTLALPASTTISVFGASVVDDASASDARSTLDVDQAGTDNSTDVSLGGTPDYITITGQVITRNDVDLAADITGTLPAANGGTAQTSLAAVDAADWGSGAGTDNYVLTADGAGGAAWEVSAGGAETNDLEGDGAVGIADTELFFGTGAGTGNYAAASGDLVFTNAGVASIQANSVALGTDTTGNYVLSATDGDGISGGDGGSEGAALTFAVDLIDDGDAQTATTSSESGLEFVAGELGLIRGCDNAQIQKWDETNGHWACSADSTGGSPTFDAIASGTNISAEMVVGNGAEIELEEGGAIESNEVVVFAQNETGATLYKCTAVHIHEFDNPSALPEAIIADADNATNMPAIGLVYADIADGESGKIIIGGTLLAADTTTGEGWSEGDRLYIDDSGSATSADCGENLTSTRPANTDDKVQAIATVVRTHGIAGKLVVSGAGRSNDVPNLESGKIWLGSSTNVAVASDVPALPIIWRVTNNVSPLSASTDDLACFRVKDALTLGGISATVVTGGSTSGTLTVDVNESGVTIMSANKLDIQYTATVDDDTAAVSDTAIAAGSVLCAEVDAVSAGGTELGITIILE